MMQTLRRWWCILRKRHRLIYRTTPDRVWVYCPACGYESPGWWVPHKEHHG